jgi:uncharacterized protein YbaP (TraB family)
VRLPVAILLTLVALLQSAAAQSNACTGTSLIPSIRSETPQVCDEAVAAMASITNGAGLFWRIEKEGIAPSWLFGTMHVPDPKVMALADEVSTEFRDASTLVVESTEVLERAGSLSGLQRHLSQVLLPAGEAFDAGFSDEQKADLSALTAAHGIPYFAARRMQPWFLAAALGIPPCVKQQLVEGAPVLDGKLFEDARAAGKTVVGLETLDEQFSALASLDRDVQTAALLETAQLGLERIDDWYATMVDLYAAGQVALAPLLVGQISGFEAIAGSVADMNGPLIEERNLRMRDRLLPILNAGDAFVAVGALHLNGGLGLVALLQAEGFRLSRIR